MVLPKLKRRLLIKKKTLGVIAAASADTEIYTKPNAPWSLATEILAHRKFVKLQYQF